MKEQKLLHFVETQVFTQRLESLGSRELLFAIQEDLLAAPRKWPVVSGTGGARKARIADDRGNKGRSGGFRYMYIYMEVEETIHLLLIYRKTEQSDLSPEQIKLVGKLIDLIKEQR